MNYEPVYMRYDKQNIQIINNKILSFKQKILKLKA